MIAQPRRIAVVNLRNRLRDLLGSAKRRQDRRQEQLEGAMDAIRRKYGRSAIAFGDGEEGEPHTEE